MCSSNMQFLKKKFRLIYMVYPYTAFAAIRRSVAWHTREMFYKLRLPDYAAPRRRWRSPPEATRFIT